MAIAKQLESYRRTLLARERELTAGIARASAEVPEQDELAIQDYGDKATSTYTKDSLLQQRSQDSAQLVAVQEALRRIGEGTYGECAECGEAIAPKRLEAMPWAALCVRCQQLHDEFQADGGAPSRVVM